MGTHPFFSECWGLRGGRPVGQAPSAEGTSQDGRPGFTSQLDHFLSVTFHFSEPVSPSVIGSDGRIA